MGKKFLNILYIVFLLPTIAWGQDFSAPNQLLLSIDGRPTMVVTDPNGNQVGSQGLTVWQDADNAELAQGPDYQNITYNLPVTGQYRLSFYGQHDEQFAVTLASVSNNKYREYNFERWAEKNKAGNMTFDLSVNDEGRLSLTSPQFSRPLGRATKTSDNNTTITWEAIPNATRYSVYSKYFDYPYFAHLGDTTDTTFPTETAWASDSGDMLRPDNLHYFVVAAHYTDGTTSVLSRYISNGDQDNDNFNDWHETYLKTDPTNSDTDGDGLDDFEEVNRYYTDPLVTDSDGDGHNDGNEVSAGTLPNQAISYPGRESECDAPESGAWHIDTDCNVVRDQDVPGDIVVHPHAVMRIWENITLWFDYSRHKILVLFGGGIKMDPGASIQQK